MAPVATLRPNFLSSGFRLKGSYLGDSETVQLNWITRLREFESDQSEPQLTQLFHTAGNLVAGLQPLLLVLGIAQNHSFRSPGENDVACSQSDVTGNVADNVSCAEDEIICTGRLARLAVDPALDLQLVGIDLIRGNEIRAQRGKLVQRLASQPFAPRTELQLPRAQVVADAIARHMRKRIGFADVSGVLADHDDKFGFVIKFVGDFDGELDIMVVAAKGIVEFAEQHGLLWNRQVDFFGMTPVVQAHAYDLFRTRHDRPVRDARFVEKRLLGMIGLKHGVNQRIQAWTV